MPHHSLSEQTRIDVAQALEELIDKHDLSFQKLAMESGLSAKMLQNYSVLRNSPNEDGARWILERLKHAREPLVVSMPARAQYISRKLNKRKVAAPESSQPEVNRKTHVGLRTTLEAVRDNHASLAECIAGIRRTQEIANPIVKAGLSEVINKLEDVLKMLDI